MHKQTNGGFTLIEILIAMSLVSIAMMISLNAQFRSRQAALNYQYKNIAMRHAAELATWMGLVEEFSRNSAENEKNIPVLLRATLKTNQSNSQITCFYAECNLTQQLQFDFTNWQHRLRMQVPGARVEVCRDDQVWQSDSHTWRWDCGGDDQSPTVIKIGWPLTANNQSFMPSVVLAVGPISL